MQNGLHNGSRTTPLHPCRIPGATQTNAPNRHPSFTRNTHGPKPTATRQLGAIAANLYSTFAPNVSFSSLGSYARHSKCGFAYFGSAWRCLCFWLVRLDRPAPCRQDNPRQKKPRQEKLRQEKLRQEKPRQEKPRQERSQQSCNAMRQIGARVAELAALPPLLRPETRQPP